MNSDDYYTILGIRRDASSADVKTAFRGLALKFHPDRHANSSKHHQEAASERFKLLSEAYEVLSDEKKRVIYNREGRAGLDHHVNHGWSYGRREGSAKPGSDSWRGAYDQDPFRAFYRAGRQSASPFQWRFRFSVGFNRVDYIFHGLIVVVALIGFSSANTIGDAIWKKQNVGKSFEETMEAVERGKQKKAAEEESRGTKAR